MNDLQELHGKNLGLGRSQGVRGAGKMKPPGSLLEARTYGYWLRPEPGSRACITPAHTQGTGVPRIGAPVKGNLTGILAVGKEE
jgi:hypothetical protein